MLSWGVPESVLLLQFSLFHLRKLTPFAWLAALGAAVAVLGAVILILAGGVLEVETELGRDSSLDAEARAPLRPDEPGFQTWLASISFLENGYYVFLVGVILLAIGIYPFVAAAPN